MPDNLIDRYGDLHLQQLRQLKSRFTSNNLIVMIANRNSTYASKNFDI
jgi:hypothetical protein